MVRQTVLEVSLRRLKFNFQYLRRKAHGRQLLLVLKANAYGHSLVDVAQFFEKNKKGIFGIAVANVEEGIALRRAKITLPILILSGVQDCSSELFRCLKTLKLTPVISSVQVLRQVLQFANEQNSQIAVHLKFNTGMNRLGIAQTELSQVLRLVEDNPRLSVEGLMSHFAASEKPTDSRTKNQVKIFSNIVSGWAEKFGPPRFVHMENSHGLQNELFPEGNLCRIGLNLFGLENKNLQAVAKWSAQIYQVREINAGEGIGYGPNFVASKKMRMAIVGAGYADGYPRALSNKSFVLVKGRRCRVLGSISMDSFAIDISRIGRLDLKKDRAILLGKVGKERISAEKLAEFAKTIPWEIMTNISARVPRKFIR
jgi:alanine racemase